MIQSFFKELFRVGMYKNAQGKIARRLTFLGLAVVFASGSWCLIGNYGYTRTNVIIAGLVFLVGLWISYRVVNFPVFADFLVSVEAEMNKVSWPSKSELFSTTKVVLIFMFLFTALIFAYDIIYGWLFSLLR